MKKNDSVSSGTRPAKSHARRPDMSMKDAPDPAPPPPSFLERINAVETYSAYSRKPVWTFILGILGDMCGSVSLTGEVVRAPSVNTWLTIASLRTIAQGFERRNGQRVIQHSSTRDAMQLIQMMEDRPQIVWDADDRVYIEGMRTYLCSNGRQGIPTDRPYVTDCRSGVGSAAIFRESPYNWFPVVSSVESRSPARWLMHRGLAASAARAFSLLIQYSPDEMTNSRLYQVDTHLESPFRYSPAPIQKGSGHFPTYPLDCVRDGFPRIHSDQEEELTLRGGHQMLMEYLRERPIAEIVEVTDTGVCATQVLALSAWIRYRNKGDVRAAINEAIAAGVYPATVACLVGQLHALHDSFDPKQVSDWIEELGVGDMLLELLEQELLPVLKTVYG